MKTIPIEVVRARERDPEAKRAAQERADLATERIRPHMERMTELGERARREPDVFRKFELLRQIADLIVAAMSGISACSKSNCSHCCNTPVVMIRLEAGIIAGEIGRKVHNPKEYSREYNPAYIGTPCPFLVDGKCSIYASRPLACRLQFNLDADDLLCHLFPDEAPISVPYFNRMDYDMLEILAVGPEHAQRFADIRDFFK